MQDKLELLRDRFGHQYMDVLSENGEPEINIAETATEFVVTANLPGFERNDVELRVTDETLRVEPNGSQQSPPT